MRDVVPAVHIMHIHVLTMHGVTILRWQRRTTCSCISLQKTPIVIDDGTYAPGDTPISGVGLCQHGHRPGCTDP